MLSFNKTLTIAGRTIAQNTPPLIIAELSGNHGGSLSQALALLDQCAAQGVEMVKFQTYEASTITLDCDRPEFVVQTELWKDRKLYDLYKEAQTPFDWHPALFNHARKLGMIPISSPFDRSAVDLLESLDCPAYKIASCEMSDFDLLRTVAKTGKPIILSTGASSIQEIEESLTFLADLNVRNVCLLHCISNYPTRAKQANLASIQHLADKFNILVGFSDHTEGLTIPTAAVALGSVIIEKHVRLDEDTESIDSAFSLQASKIKKLIKACNRSWKALGAARVMPFESEVDTLRFKRSLYITEDINKGDLFSHTSVKSLRPSGGMHTKYLPQIIGKAATKDLKRATPLEHHMIEGWAQKKNILITSASNKWILITLFKKSALRKGLKVYTADMNPECKGQKYGDEFIQLPADNDPDYKQALFQACKENHIGMIIPTRDGELAFFASIKEDLNEAGIFLPMPSKEHVETCIDKLAFYKHCLNHDMPVAQKIAPDQVRKFPVFVRHRTGAAGQHAELIHDLSELQAFPDLENSIIQPYIEAPEYSCDILSDMNGKALHVIVRERLKIKKGESRKSLIVNKQNIATLAKKCADSLSLKGHSLVQIFDHPHKGPLLIEVNARFGGCSYLSVTGGLDSPKHLIDMMLGQFKPDTDFKTFYGLESHRKGKNITYKHKSL
ncbi:pseudaminic acid synthase [Temperatibacter marinus]|uniref:Pseudaminic acid synthase n=1 Tax=Temperatibacter marinus TaxID=1456591 RepID=A0AA52EED9_9PROT|nr:pseudaminic acid synthase [Temperatibacter marinus]WND01548.1 pseudaminic acid synthase [Temperatibacter marinus]